jgi:hypothetical protein
MAFWKEQSHMLISTACERPEEVVEELALCGFIVSV